MYALKVVKVCLDMKPSLSTEKTLLDSVILTRLKVGEYMGYFLILYLLKAPNIFFNLRKVFECLVVLSENELQGVLDYA